MFQLSLQLHSQAYTDGFRLDHASHSWLGYLRSRAGMVSRSRTRLANTLPKLYRTRNRTPEPLGEAKAELNLT